MESKIAKIGVQVDDLKPAKLIAVMATNFLKTCLNFILVEPRDFGDPI